MIEIQKTRLQKLQMCSLMDCSKQEAQGDSVQDDEDTFSQNDEVTFELCKDDEQKEMITEEIKEVSKYKNQSVDIKVDEDEDEPSINTNAYVQQPTTVIYEESMKGVGLFENPIEKFYILLVIL